MCKGPGREQAADPLITSFEELLKNIDGLKHFISKPSSRVLVLRLGCNKQESLTSVQHGWAERVQPPYREALESGWRSWPREASLTTCANPDLSYPSGDTKREFTCIEPTLINPEKDSRRPTPSLHSLTRNQEPHFCA